MRELIRVMVYTSLLEEHNMEKDMCKDISNIILDDILDNMEISDNTDEKVKLGAWVFKEGLGCPWVFERYNTISDAVRRATGMIDAKVICDGHIIEYDTIDNETAYYTNPWNGKIKNVNLGEVMLSIGQS